MAADEVAAVPTDGAVAGGGRRVEILDVATHLFRAQGYHSTSLDDIAAAIGFTKPAIYYYFASKEDILFTIVSEHVDRALDRVLGIARGPGSALQRMHALLLENGRTVLHNRDVNTVFYDERNALSPEREADMRDRERTYTRVVRDLYVEGVETGEFLDMDATVATATILGASIWSYRWFDDAGPLSVEEVADGVWQLLSVGLVA